MPSWTPYESDQRLTIREIPNNTNTLWVSSSAKLQGRFFPMFVAVDLHDMLGVSTVFESCFQETLNTPQRRSNTQYSEGLGRAMLRTTENTNNNKKSITTSIPALFEDAPYSQRVPTCFFSFLFLLAESHFVVGFVGFVFFPHFTSKSTTVLRCCFCEGTNIPMWKTFPQTH